MLVEDPRYRQYTANDPMKILIVISNDLFVRNYLYTGAFSRIDDNECYYIAADSIMDKHTIEAKRNFVGYYRTDGEIEAKHIELLNVLMWNYRKKCKTFLYRFLMLHWPETAHWYRINKPKNQFRRALRIIRALKYPILGTKLISNVAVPILKSRIKINQSIEKKIRAANPDLVIMPSSAYDPVATDITRLSKTFGFKTLFLVDNWDNLSSKSIMWDLPDYLGVWGEQSREHAINIHGMPPNRVFNIGTPRFEKYFTTISSDHLSPYEFAYLLFCGYSLAFDELSALRILDREIDENQAIYGNIKIVYRPHPARQECLCPHLFSQEEFANVILDEPAKAYHYNKKVNLSQTDLNYYPALLFNAKLIIAPPTTMIIESLACGKKTLVIAYDDGIHFTSPHNLMKYVTHVQGIENINSLVLCRDKEQLAKTMRNVIQSDEPERSSILSSLHHFLYHDSLPYADRLTNLINNISLN